MRSMLSVDPNTNAVILRFDDFPVIHLDPPNERYIKVIAAHQINKYRNASIVVADIPPGGSTGLHTHPESDEIVIPLDKGKCILEGRTSNLESGTVLIVPKGVEHEFWNSGEVGNLRIICLFVPPFRSTGWLHDYAAQIGVTLTNENSLGNENESDQQPNNTEPAR